MMADFLSLCRYGERGSQELTSVAGVHAAMDLTLPGLISELSAEQDGAWIEVPDSRAWDGTLGRAAGVGGRARM
jgi:hypothetical protein